jgi:hypothetical protein
MQNFPMDTQRLRVEVKAARAAQFVFETASHDAESQPQWTRDLLGEASEVKKNGYDEEARQQVAFLWPWLAIVGLPQESSDPQPPPAGSCIVQRDKHAAVYAEWSSYDVVESKTRKTLSKESRTGAIYNVHTFRIIVSRRPWRMFVSKVLPTFLIASASFGVVCMPPDDASSRLQTLVALLVSLVLLHSDASSDLEELTLMALYSSASLFVLLAAMLVVAIAKVLTSGPPDRDMPVHEKWAEHPFEEGLGFDFRAWQFLAALWLAINVGFAAYVLFLVRRQRARKNHDDKRKAEHADEAKQIRDTPRANSRAASADSE